MAMDFPLSPVDKKSLGIRLDVRRLPIFPDEESSAAALLEMFGRGGRAGEQSCNGSRGVVVYGPGRSSPAHGACLVCKEARGRR
uniref:Uncharacterized protein n=1 Tax=Aegilops tauschii TaxID=37682 RepID=R7W7A2_AEGTA